MKTLKMLMLAGIGLAVIGVAGAVIGFATDDTYPEEIPGWAPVVIGIGAVVALVAAVARGFLSGVKSR